MQVPSHAHIYQPHHDSTAANFLRDLCQRLLYKFKHIPGDANIADILTKAQAHAVFARLIKLLREPELLQSM